MRFALAVRSGASLFVGSPAGEPVLQHQVKRAAGKRPGDPGYPRRVFLVHGDPEAQLALEPKVRALGFATHVPHWHEHVTLD